MKFPKKINCIAMALALLASMTTLAAGSAIVDLSITGIDGSALINLRQHLAAKTKMITENTPPRMVFNLFHNIPEQAKKALAPFGYFRATINTTLSQKKNRWQIVVNVTKNQRMPLSTVSIQILGPGKNDPAFKQYLAKINIKKGNYLDAQKYDDAKENLKNMASNRGYFNAKFEQHQLKIDLRRYQASIVLIMNTGVRQKIGRTVFSKTPFNTSLLKRYLKYQTGEYYNNEALEKTRQNLINSQFFQAASLKPITKKGITTIKINLSTQDQVHYTLGAGYGTDNKFRGMAAMNIAWLNRNGHSMRALARGSNNNSEIGLHYQIPGQNPILNQYHINVSLRHLNYGPSIGSAKNAQTNINYQTKWHSFQLQTGLTYLTENYELQNFPIKNTSTKTNANILYPQLLLQTIQATPNLISPNQGVSISFNLSAGSKALFSKNDFTRSFLQIKSIYTIEKTHTRIIARSNIGAISIKNLINLPFSMQFYTGGSFSIRGFKYNSIGPGRHLFSSQFEVQQRIYKNLYLAGFIDCGNVTDKIFKRPLKIGAGPAIAYLSPIGAVELSFAKNISSQDPVSHRHNGGWHIHFSLGALL